MIQVNINETVKVKLTKHGKAIWKDYHNIPEMVNLKRGLYDDGIEMRKDEEGFWTFQLWQLMEIFGPHIGLASPNCFDANILFPNLK